MLKFHHFGSAELIIAHYGLIDQKAYVCRIFFVDDALECVGGGGRVYGCGISKGGGSYDAIGHFHARKHIFFVALSYIESEVKFAVHHCRIVDIADGNCHDATIVVAYYSCIAAHFLALKGCGSCGGFGTGINEYGSDGHLSVFLKKFSGDIGCNHRGNVLTYHFKWIGICREIVRLKLTHLAVAGRHGNQSADSK